MEEMPDEADCESRETPVKPHVESSKSQLRSQTEILLYIVSFYMRHHLYLSQMTEEDILSSWRHGTAWEAKEIVRTTKGKTYRILQDL